MRRRAWIGLAALAWATARAQAQSLRVLAPDALHPVVAAMAPGFANKTGLRLRLVAGTADALAQRVRAGEPFDLLLLPGPALQALAQAGLVQPASLRPLARLTPGPVDMGLALPPSSALADAAEVLVRSLTGPTAAEVMRLYQIEPLF